MRSYTVIPAAGRSERMGKPKLLLPWRGAAVIEHVLAAWRASGVTQAVVVTRADDESLMQTVRQAGGQVVAVDPPPPDMKASVLAGLQFVERTWTPVASDVWLLAPADMPGLSAAVIDHLLAAHDVDHPTIIVPTRNQRRGHPVLFPWTISREVRQLGDMEGVNTLLARHAVREILGDDLSILDDLDTPQDYQRLLDRE